MGNYAYKHSKVDDRMNNVLMMNEKKNPFKFC